MSEVRVTDPKTGGQKGRKSDRFDLIPADFERALAEHYGKGAEKYEDRNWERGYDWSLSYRALRSHLAWWWAKQDFDAETGSNHLIAVAWHAIALYTFQTRGLGTDDRPAVGPLNGVQFNPYGVPGTTECWFCHGQGIGGKCAVCNPWKL